MATVSGGLGRFTWIMSLGVLVWCGAVGAQQKALEAPTGTGRISGVVVAADSGLALPGVMVTVGTAGAGSFFMTTGADGRYVAQGLVAGRYRLTFSKAGFVTLEYGQRTAFSPASPIELRGGQAIDTAHVSLPRAGAIEGRVTDASGQPLADVPVRALRPEWGNDGVRLVPAGRQVATDDRGGYRLWGLDSADYYVSATFGLSSLTASPAVPGTRVFAPVFFPGTGDVDLAARVPVRRGDVTGIDIALSPVRTARVRGTVVANPIISGGTALSLVRAGGVAGLAGVVETQPDGSFEFRAVTPGKYALRAMAAPPAVWEKVAATGRPDALSQTRDVQIGVMALEVSGEDIDGVALQTTRPGILKGRVLLDGQPYEPQGRVAISPAPADAFSLVVASLALAVEPDGTFELANLLGRFVLRVQGLPASLGLSAVTQSRVDVTDSGVQVSPGETVEDVLIELAPPATRLTGRVASGCEAVAECDVLVFARDEQRWTLPQTRYVARARTSDGRFDVAGLPAGSYLAVALPSLERGRERDPAFLRELAASPLAASVTLHPGQPQAIGVSLIPNP